MMGINFETVEKLIEFWINRGPALARITGGAHNI